VKIVRKPFASQNGVIFILNAKTMSLSVPPNEKVHSNFSSPLAAWERKCVGKVDKVIFKRVLPSL